MTRKITKKKLIKYLDGARLVHGYQLAARRRANRRLRD